jgi:hypothetical protein
MLWQFFLNIVIVPSVKIELFQINGVGNVIRRNDEVFNLSVHYLVVKCLDNYTGHLLKIFSFA